MAIWGKWSLIKIKTHHMVRNFGWLREDEIGWILCFLFPPTKSSFINLIYLELHYVCSTFKYICYCHEGRNRMYSFRCYKIYVKSINKNQLDVNYTVVCGGDDWQQFYNTCVNYSYTYLYIQMVILSQKISVFTRGTIYFKPKKIYKCVKFTINYGPIIARPIVLNYIVAVRSVEKIKVPKKNQMKYSAGSYNY